VPNGNSHNFWLLLLKHHFNLIAELLAACILPLYGRYSTVFLYCSAPEKKPDVDSSKTKRSSAGSEESDDSDDDLVGPVPPPPGAIKDGEEEDEEEEEEREESMVDKIPRSHEIKLVHGSKPITALSLDPSGARVISGGVDYDLKFWDFAGMDPSLRSFRKLRPCESHVINHLGTGTYWQKLKM
jgi:hypothetical protein